MTIVDGSADTIPIRLTPLPGEALDSYLETYAHRLHVSVADIFRLAGLPVSDHPIKGSSKPWIVRLSEPHLAALSAVSGIPAARLTAMTMARYHGTGLTPVPPTGRGPVRPRWWLGLKGSRFCPRCLADNGNRWMLSWRLAWSFACTVHQVLLADTCRECGRRHLLTRTPDPHFPGKCDTTGLSLPQPRRRGGTLSCHNQLDQANTVPLDPDGPVLAAQRRINSTIAAILAAHEDDMPADLSAAQHVLDDIHAVAHTSLQALAGPVEPPPAVRTLGYELLGSQPHLSPHGHHQRAGRVAFGAAVATLMIHSSGRSSAAPDPEIAEWLVQVAVGRDEANPSLLLHRWRAATPALQGALLKALGPRLPAAYQLRYRTAASAPGRPRTRSGKIRAAAIPSLFWRGWTLRLNPHSRFDTLPYRQTLSVLLLATGTDLDYQRAQAMLSHPAANSAKYAHFTGLLRRAGALDAVMSALSQLAHRLDENGTPIDYARRRRRLSQAELDLPAWRRHCARTRHRAYTRPRPEHFAQLYLIELLTCNHPSYLPAPLTLALSDRTDYTTFVFRLPKPLATHLHEQAHRILRRSQIYEPVRWEPPFDWVSGVDWPGPHPDDIAAEDMWTLIRAGLTQGQVADRLNTSREHIRLLAQHHPTPTTRRSRSQQAPELAHPEPPSLGQLRAYREQGLGPRQIARLTNCNPVLIGTLLADAGLAPSQPRQILSTIDSEWLRHEYEDNQRTIKDIAADLDTSPSDLARRARELHIPIRHGVTSRKHLLADHGGPGAFPSTIWAAFAGHRADHRIRRFLATPGHADLNRAANRLGTRKATLARQVSQLEQTVGATLLGPTPSGLALTPAGQQFAQQVRPILDLLDHPHR